MSPIENKKLKLNNFIESIRELNFSDCSEAEIIEFQNGIKNQENPIIKFMSSDGMSIESGTKFFKAVKNDASYGKKDISILGLKNKIDAFVEKFEDYGLTHQKLVKGLASNSRPSMLLKSYSWIKQNINNLVEEYRDHGLTHEKITDTASSYFQLFYIDYKESKNNINKVCERFEAQGLSKEQYLRMACVFPGLFASNSQKVIARIDKIQEMYKKEVFSHYRDEVVADENNVKTTRRLHQNVWDCIERKPIALTYSTENLQDRAMYAKIKKQTEAKTLSFVGLFKPSSAKIKEFLAENRAFLISDKSKKLSPIEIACTKKSALTK